jgi:RHS repeat-associated protein
MADNPYADFNGSGSLTYRYLYGQALDEILARQSASGGVAFYLTDHEGSVRQLAAVDGAILDYITYDDFGGITSETHPENGDRFKYTGREWDGAIGLYNFRARMYDPANGVFLSKDPLGFAAGDANTSRFVGNDPSNFIDPSGLFLEEAAAFGSGMLQGVRNLGGAVYGAAKTVVGTVATGAGEVAGVIPAAYQGINNLAGGDSRAYENYRGGLDNMWGDVGAAAKDVIKPWNPYEANNPVSANDARKARNAAMMRAAGASEFTIGAMKAGDAIGYYGSNMAAGCAAAKALGGLRYSGGGAGADALVNSPWSQQPTFDPGTPWLNDPVTGEGLSIPGLNEPDWWMNQPSESIPSEVPDFDLEPFRGPLGPGSGSQFGVPDGPGLWGSGTIPHIPLPENFSDIFPGK